MEKLLNIFKLLFTAAGTVLTWFFGGIDSALVVLICFSCIDYITGISLAVLKKQLSSSVGFKGILKKAAIFFVVGLSSLTDNYIAGGGGLLRSAVIFFYISNEGVSVLENISEIGVPVPEKIKAVLAQIRKED